MKRFFTILSFVLFLGAIGQTMSANTTERDIVLSNEYVELVFSSGNDFLFKEYNTGGKNILPEGGSNVHPWEMVWLGPNGENPVLQPRWSYYMGFEVKEGAGETTAVFTWEVVLEATRWPVNVYVTVRESEELPEWRIDAGLPEGWVITEAEFPRIAVKRLKDCKGIMPVGYGAEYDIPFNAHIQTRYPSVTGVMQLILMHNQENTVYFSAKDKTGSHKVLRMKGEGDNVVFSQKIVTSYAWSENGKFTLPWATVLGYNPDRWENTVARWYRPFTFETEWGAKTIDQREITDWIRNADMWLRPADATPEMMEAVRKALAFYGKGTGMHWYYWHKHPFDTNYPEYFPEQDGFKEMIKESQKLGGYVTPYINGRLWDSANHTYKELGGPESSCRKADGTLYTEVYSSKVLNTVTCPSAPSWRKILRDLNETILYDLKTDGVYMDQIGCAASEPCYADNHDHPKGGGGWWPAAYRTLLTEMDRNLYRKKHAMTTEENVECYIDLFDMMLVVNSPHTSTVKMVPLFPLIYSDRCIYSGYTYIPWKLNDGSMNFITMKSLLWGSQLGWVNPELLMRPENKVEAQFCKTLASFRKQSHDLFLGGRFIGEFVPGGDNPLVNIPNYQETNVVMGAEWESLGGQRVYLLVNMSGTDRCVVLPDGRSADVKAYDAVRISK